MEEAVYQQNFQNEPIQIEYRTALGSLRTTHWHKELEIIYLLNGTMGVVIEGQRYKLVQGDALVIDSNLIHEVQARQSMMQIIIHVDRDFIDSKLSGQGKYLIHCSREELVDEQLGAYLEILDCLKQLPPLYVQQPTGYRIESESIALDVIYRLIRDFSIPLHDDDAPSLTQRQMRTKEILQYVDAHYKEPLSLEDIAGEFSLSREYFSRLFRQSVGITFTEHLNRVRLTHIYHDLIATDQPIMRLIEEHGFTNYKLFSRMFREIYGSTPRNVRKHRQ